jgi:hypothetical protein
MIPICLCKKKNRPPPGLLKSRPRSFAPATIPTGLAIHPDATVRGIPTEMGDFESTLEIDEANGELSQKGFAMHVGEWRAVEVGKDR